MDINQSQLDMDINQSQLDFAAALLNAGTFNLADGFYEMAVTAKFPPQGGVDLVIEAYGRRAHGLQSRSAGMEDVSPQPGTARRGSTFRSSGCTPRPRLRMVYTMGETITSWPPTH